MPGNLVGSGFDPRLFPRRLGLQFNRIPLFFGPAHIHPRQHRSPIAALSPARARVDFEEGVIAVGLTVQQGLKLFLGGLGPKRLDRRLGVLNDLFILFHLTQFDQLNIVAEIGLDGLIGLDGIDQQLPLAHQFLRVFGIVPQVGVLDAGVEFLQPMRRGFIVHALRQQLQRLFDLRHGVLGFGAHGLVPTCSIRPA